MKKIYLVINHAVYDYEDCGISTIAFDTRDKAEKFFKEQVAKEREEIKDMDWVVGVDTDDEFEAYEDGCYSQYNTWCKIRELVIE